MPSISNFIVLSEPITKLLAFKECGQIGVIIIDSILGDTIGPPADKEYAVEPVGVAIIKPSPEKVL